MITETKIENPFITNNKNKLQLIQIKVILTKTMENRRNP